MGISPWAQDRRLARLGDLVKQLGAIAGFGDTME